MAIDQAGGAVVVWQRFSEFGHWVVQGATRGADGTIASLGNLSDTSSDDEAPQVAVDPAGDAVAVWQQDDHQRNIVSIQAAARSAGGGLVSLGELSVPGQSGEQDDESPQVALDRAGDAFAVWEHFDGTNFVVQSAVRPAGAAKFGAPVDVSLPQSTAHENAVGPQIAVDPAGDEIVVWALGGGSDGHHWAVQAAVRPAGATRFDAPQELSVAGQNQDPQVAVDQAGDAIAVWQRFDGAHAFVDAASLPAGASAWSAVELAGAADPSSPQVALDAAGDAVAVWNDTNSVNQTVGTAYRPAGGSFSTPGSLSRPGANATDPHVALDQAGQTYAVWVGSDGKNSIVEGFLPDPPPGPGPPIAAAAGQRMHATPGPAAVSTTNARADTTRRRDAVAVGAARLAASVRDRGPADRRTLPQRHASGSQPAALHPADRAEGQPQAHRRVDGDVQDRTRGRRPTSREAVRGGNKAQSKGAPLHTAARPACKDHPAGPRRPKPLRWSPTPR